MPRNTASSAKPAIKLLDFVAKLATPLVPDDYIELLNPLWVRGAQRAVVEDVRAETADAATITLRPSSHWQGHHAGQFVQIAVAVDGVRHQRTYSISSAPERADGRISITVKAVDEGRVSNFLVHALRVGSVIEVSTAGGDFLWPSNGAQPLLLIAAGSGITPIMSQLRSAAARNAMPQATLMYYSPSAADCIFYQELQALAAAHPALTLHCIHTRGAAEHDRASGHLSTAQLAALCPDWAARHTLACGPESLLDVVLHTWGEAGLAAQLTTERFRAKRAALNGQAQGGKLHLLASNLLCTSDGQQSMLETAEAAGLAPAHGCRMGICHGCTVTLKSGQVRDLRDGRIYGEEDDLIQICVCAPAGDVAIAL